MYDVYLYRSVHLSSSLQPLAALVEVVSRTASNIINGPLGKVTKISEWARSPGQGIDHYAGSRGGELYHVRLECCWNMVRAVR